jgi:hypothetical protein
MALLFFGYVFLHEVRVLEEDRPLPEGWHKSVEAVPSLLLHLQQIFLFQQPHQLD